MSWLASLYDAETLTAVQVVRHRDGTVTGVHGSECADLEVSYNLGEFFPFLDLDGHQARTTIDTLHDAVLRLGTKQLSDYWKGTPGNAGAVCAVLLEWGRQYPEAVWHVD